MRKTCSASSMLTMPCTRACEWYSRVCMQARVSDVPDFDFMQYAEQRLEQYLALREVALGACS